MVRLGIFGVRRWNEDQLGVPIVVDSSGSKIFGQKGGSDEETFDWRLPAEIATEAGAAVGVESGHVAFGNGGGRWAVDAIDETAVHIAGLLSAVSCVGDAAKSLDLDPACHVAANVGDVFTAQIDGIDGLREKSPCVKKLQILCVGEQTHSGLDLTAAKLEPALVLIVGDGPIKRRPPTAQMPDVTVVDLGADVDLFGDLTRRIGPEIG
jgi:hypothetical protein